MLGAIMGRLTSPAQLMQQNVVADPKLTIGDAIDQRIAQLEETLKILRSMKAETNDEVLRLTCADIQRAMTLF